MNRTQTDPEGPVGARIRGARRSAGLSQKALAALMGVTAQSVRAWEAGRRNPTAEHLAAVTLHCEAARADGAVAQRRSPVRVTARREEKMGEVVGAIAGHAAEHGYPPTLRDVQFKLGLSSVSVVDYWLDRCEEAGLIERAREVARGVTLTEAGRALAEAAGEPGGQPPVRAEDPLPGAAGSAGAADAATDADPPACGIDRKTTAPRGPRAPETGRTEPTSGVGARIRKARRSADLTQRELAALIGVSSQTVWAWEAGRMRPTYEHRLKVASHCGRDVGELDGRTGADRDLLEETVAAFLGAVEYLPERDIKSIWLFIGYVRWRRKDRRAA